MINALVVDDDQLLLEALKYALSRLGLSVETAANGELGVKCYDASCFEVVVTDIEMPVQGGLELLRYIRKSERPTTPVVGISANPGKLEQGDFNARLVKPFSLNELVKILMDARYETDSVCRMYP